MSKVNRILIITIATALALTATLFLSYSPTRAQDSVDSADLARFVVLMQHIRSQPTPADVRATNVPALAGFDSFFSDIYITGFITPFTGETPEQVKARLQSVPDEDRFTAVMVESYRLSSNPLLLNIIHNLLARYYVDYFTTSDLGGASDFLKRTEITSLADSFDSTSYTIPAPSTTQIPTTPAADRAALTALYNATDGPNWTNNTNWLSDRPLGEWFGVSADSAGRVTRLDLSKNQLTGAIPPELGSLDKLTWLSLWENQLTGSIPPELGDLTNLETLNLGQNQLTGSIPPELGDLTNLETLNLGQNQLTGSIPPELGDLTNLE